MTSFTKARLATYLEWADGVSAGRQACAVINADDWGESAQTTTRILDCVRAGSVSAASAMVFMPDSKRAAEIAREIGLDTGLHLNLSTPFLGPSVPTALSRHHIAVVAYLRRSRLNRYLYHPGLVNSFEYVVRSQREEYERRYGGAPWRVDGHHHLHLCANVVVGGLLPRGVVIRRNLLFFSGEKGLPNRLARRCYDVLLSRRYRMVDALLTLAPLHPSSRTAAIFQRALRLTVEIATHPAVASEHDFLVGDRICEFVEKRCWHSDQNCHLRA